MKLSVVIPAHNEALVLASTVRDLAERLSAEKINHEILIINDHSTDDTELVLHQLQTELLPVRYLSNPNSPGFGLAVRHGLENFSGDAAAVYMADASDRPEDLVAFYRTMIAKNVDCVFGSRFVEGAKVIDYPILKLFLNRLANNGIRLVFNLGYNDVTNAFKLYRRSVIQGVQYGTVLRLFLSFHSRIASRSRSPRPAAPTPTRSGATTRATCGPPSSRTIRASSPRRRHRRCLRPSSPTTRAWYPRRRHPRRCSPGVHCAG